MRQVHFIQMFVLAVFAAAFSTSCGSMADPEDCGYEARLRRPDGANNVEIRIHRVTSEKVGSVTSCGYSYVHTRAKVEIGGTEIPERVGPTRVTETYVNRNDQGGVDYFYEAPATFDPRKDVIQIENQEGNRYTSRPNEILASNETRTTVALKR